MAERLPRAFGDYVLERRLGVGGMAETFVARRGATRQHVCVKRVLPAFSSDRDFVQQFEREARLAGRLRHSNVVGVVDFGAVDGELFLALELIEGVDLRALLMSQPQRRLRQDVAALIALDLAYALEYAHGEQVVHRDVTPSNVLLSVRGEVKLADFGVAKALTTTTLPTASGFLKGKVPYMAPEQMKGGAIDGRTDVFSLGVTLFEMLAGRRPFVGAHDVEVMMRVLAGERPRLSELVPGTALEPLTDAALAVEHTRRPTTSDLVQALAPLVGSEARPELARLVRVAFGTDVPLGERDTAFAPALLADRREGDSALRPDGIVPSTIVSRGVPIGPSSSPPVSGDLHATVPQRPGSLDTVAGSVAMGDSPLGATAAARPGLLMGVGDPASSGLVGGGVVGSGFVGSAAVAIAPSLETDPASSSGVQPRAERFADVTDPTAPLRAPAMVDEPTLPTTPSFGVFGKDPLHRAKPGGASPETPSRTVIISITIVVGLGALLAFLLFRGETEASSFAAATPIAVERTGPVTPETGSETTPLENTPTIVESDLAATERTIPLTETSAMTRRGDRPVTNGTMATTETTEMATTEMATTEMAESTPMTPETTTEMTSEMTPVVAPTNPNPTAEATDRRGRVRVSLVPWGEVWVGERYMGRAPVDLDLPVGNHSIRIGMGRPMRTERIRVSEGRRDLEFVFAEE